jgi:SET domain-containing protein
MNEAMQFSETFHPEDGTWTISHVQNNALQPWVEVRKSRIKRAGLGVFASRSFKKGSPMGAYAGALIRYDAGVAQDGMYALDAGHNRVLDGAFHGNWTRFINDGKRGRKRDMSNVEWIGNTFYTQRFIKKGEELFINYGPDYWAGMKRLHAHRRKLAPKKK